MKKDKIPKMFEDKVKWRWKPCVKSYLVKSCLIILFLGLVLKECLGYVVPKVDKTLEVDYYESVFYNPSELLERGRTKREIGGDKVQFRFSLHTKSRDFHLNLEKDTSIFHPELEIENSNGPMHINTDQVFRGHLQDDPGSYAEGVITPEGHFDGLIETSSGQKFHIEPAQRYSLPNSHFSSPGIIYEEDSIQWPAPSLKFHKELTNSALKNSSFPLKRSKRYAIDPRRKTCMLYLQADHLFFNHFGSEEASINMMARHIQRVNEIYRGTDFDGDSSPDGISFMIKRIKVHNTNASLSPDYKFNGDFQVIQFLEKFSEGDYESFCLAYMFTFRDFEGGTLGLAWTGDLKNAGGVCERKGHFRGGLKSLNTGIITLLNYGKIVLPAVSYVTLAHEIGHNFGSPHDPENDKECVPGGKDGNFIMFARATAGDQRNNQRFSPCSLRAIKPVLNAKARNIHGCFSEPQRGICGNREVEDGEECDCGWEEDCTEECCWPMRLKYEKDQVPCTLKPRKECSPSQGPCCTKHCELKAGNKCREDNGCRHTAYCDGLRAPCPQSVHKPNKTVCLDGQNVCFMGECTGSICLAYGLESCQCSPQAWDSSSKLCELCCKKPGEDKCLSSFEFNDVPFDVPDLYAKPGSPCKNYTGYCDAYRTCREVDPSGPLATLRNLLLADEGLSAIANWIDDHWYAVISFVALIIVMMVLTAKLCGKQAKKKLRKITILHSNVGAIQVERSYWDEQGEHVVHPEAVRKKIPLRKKIREKKNKTKIQRGSSKRRESQAPAAGQSSSGDPLSPSVLNSKENKGPRYGTLWRKRRAERARITTPQGKKTPEGSPAAASTSTQEHQTFDLVQLHTPPSANNNVAKSANNKPIYPVLNPSEQATASNKVSPGSSKNAQNNLSSTSAATRPLSTTPNNAAVNHQYEAKTAILPSASGAARKKRTSRRPSSSSHSRDPTAPVGAISKSKSRRPSSSSAADAAQRSKKRTTTTAPKEEVKKPKKSFQIVYTPPFSVKVVHVEPESAVAGISNNLPPQNRKPLSPILEMPLPPIPTQLPVPLIPTPADGPPPPPYTSLQEAKETSANEGQGSSHSKSKVKSSASFLQKRGRKKAKGELRVLIPPPNLQDDEGETPTPGT